MASSIDECLVRDVKLQTESLGPVLVNFQHGRLQKEDAAGLKFNVFAPNDKSTLCTVTAIPKTSNLLYQGDIPSEEDLCRFFVGVRNKRKNKMRIYEAKDVTLLPVIASHSDKALTIEKYDDAMYNLNQTFGSKRSKRASEQKKRMLANVDMVKDKLSTTVNGIELNDEQVPTNPEDPIISMLLPPIFNPDAISPADVYPICGILRDEELAAIEAIYAEAVESDQFDSQYIKTPIFKAMEKFIVPGDTRSAALLMYCDCLLNFINIKSKRLHKNSQDACSYSEMINKKIVKEFTVNDATHSFIRPEFMRDRAIAFIIIIGLHVGKFQYNLSPLIESISNIRSDRILMIATVLRTVPDRTNKVLITLKTPLPPVRKISGRARRM